MFIAANVPTPSRMPIAACTNSRCSRNVPRVPASMASAEPVRSIMAPNRVDRVRTCFDAMARVTPRRFMISK